MKANTRLVSLAAETVILKRRLMPAYKGPARMCPSDRAILRELVHAMDKLSDQALEQFTNLVQEGGLIF